MIRHVCSRCARHVLIDGRDYPIDCGGVLRRLYVRGMKDRKSFLRGSEYYQCEICHSLFRKNGGEFVPVAVKGKG